MNGSLVSIITPTYQQKKLDLFQRMLGTVQTQTHPDWEHIICSDGPPEPSIQAIVARCGDGRRRYMNATRHHGGFGAFVRQEVMMKHARGRYLVFLDDDNLIMPDYLEKMVAALEAA